MATEWHFFGSTLKDVHSQLGKRCNATLINGKVYSGYLYNIDPETHTSFILVRQEPPEPKHEHRQGQQQEKEQPPEEPSETSSDASDKSPMIAELWTMVAVRQHAMKAWEFSEDVGSGILTLEQMDVIAYISHKLTDPAEVKARKDRLVAILRSKRIPVETTEEDDVVHIMNNAHVRPPYLPASIECENAVIRERVRGMVQELQET